MATKKQTEKKPVSLEHKTENMWCISSPRVTEKSTQLAESNVYTFNVHKDANKVQITHAIENLYGVTPLKIRMVTIHSVNTMKKNIKGRTRGGKKAYVYLKKGDTISLF